MEKVWTGKGHFHLFLCAFFSYKGKRSVGPVSVQITKEDSVRDPTDEIELVLVEPQEDQNYFNYSLD